MSDRSWTVEVGGVHHTVIVDCDPQTRRAAIRVDGRMPARPMAADEDERELSIAGVPYVLRRKDGDQFELDIAPEAFLNQTKSRSSSGAAKAAPPQKSKMIWIAYVVAGLFALGLVRYGLRSFQYTHVPWQPYSDSGGSFTAKFPGSPTEKQSTENINGDLWTVHSRFATFKDHFYAVEYLDMKIVVVDANSESVMNRFLDGWAQTLGGKIEAREKSSLARNPAIRFSMAMPKGSGPEGYKLPVEARLRGVAAVRGSRLYLTWTLTTEVESSFADVHQFLDAFAVPPPDAPATFDSIDVEKPVVRAATTQPATTTQPDPAEPRLKSIAPTEPAPLVFLEPAFTMYHVAGCPRVAPGMQQVPVDQRPPDYAPDDCVPEKLRTWPIRFRRAS